MEYEIERAYSDTEMKILAIVPRIAASMSFVCGLYMALTAWKRRDRVFHRVIFALSLHVMHSMAWSFVGSWAIPADQTVALGANSTGTLVATCSAQGFGLQFSIFAGLFYFDFLALHSYVAVQNNFNTEKFTWIEKWIHLGSNGFPLLTAIVLVSVKGFNGATSNHVCYIGSYPDDCGEHGELGIPCERGPDNIRVYAFFLAVLPFFFVSLFPLVMMVLLYCKVKYSQGEIQVEARDVARQACVYLGVLFCSHGLTSINFGREFGGKENEFIATLLAAILLNLFGTFVLCFYFHFRVPVRKSAAKDSLEEQPSTLETIAKNGNEKGETTSAFVRTSTRTSGTNRSSTRTSHRGSNHRSSPKRASTGSCSQNSRVSAKMKWSFNIFDGTNAKGDFADFVFDGDSDDERYDQGETDRWKEIQDHV